MLKSSVTLAALASSALVALAGSAAAQKAKDTLRLALIQPIRVVDSFYSPNPETSVLTGNIFDHLLAYDPSTKSVKPQLAAEWKRVDDTTIEVKLRQGVKFHDGSELDADDVKYTFDFVTDPKVTFLFKDARFGNFIGAEKLDKYTLRIRSKRKSAVALTGLAANPAILPSDVHSKLENKESFGRRPVGSGPLKLTRIDTAGVTLEKNPGYTWGGFEPAAQIGRFEVSSIADAQTRVAKVMVDELDMIFHVDPEQANDIVKAKSNYKIVTVPTVSYTYIMFDAANRSGIGHFQDKRVREALVRAVDREAIRKAFLPPQFSSKPGLDSMCVPALIACPAQVKKPVAYDPARAKALLAEAGLANGFELEILTWGQSRPAAEAVAGDLRKVGVRASVSAHPVSVFQKLRGEGKAQMMVTLWDNSAGQPDSDNTIQFMWSPSTRNYAGDDSLAKWTAEAAQELDQPKREEIHRRIFDRVTEESFAVPLQELPAVIVQHKDLVIGTNHIRSEGFRLNQIRWAK